MSDKTQLTVHGYDITVDFSYTPGTDDSLEQPGDETELTINSWYFSNEDDAKELIDSEGLSLEEILNSEWMNNSIEEKLWDYIQSYDPHENYSDEQDDDYLYDTDYLEWD